MDDSELLTDDRELDNDLTGICVRAIKNVALMINFRPRQHQHEGEIDRSGRGGSGDGLDYIYRTVLRGGRGRGRVQEDRHGGELRACQRVFDI